MGTGHQCVDQLISCSVGSPHWQYHWACGLSCTSFTTTLYCTDTNTDWYMWPSKHKPPIHHILSKMRLLHHQRAHLLLIRMVLLFFQSDFPVQLWALEYTSLFQSHTALINVCKFWTSRTSSLVHHQTIAWKYAYKNLTLHSGSCTHLAVMHIRSSTCDRSSRIDYWTLNSHNINSCSKWVVLCWEDHILCRSL